MTQPMEPVAYRYKINLDTYEYRKQALTHYFYNDIHEKFIQPEPLYTAAAIEAAKQEGRREGLEEARRAVLHEVLHLELVICEEDIAYNAAINDAQNAIRALIEGKP